MTDLAVPTIHFNGSSKERLSEDLRNAITALHKAAEAVIEAAPHPRDYYVQEKGMWEKADDQYKARLTKLQEVTTELETIWEKIEFP